MKRGLILFFLISVIMIGYGCNSSKKAVDTPTVSETDKEQQANENELRLSQQRADEAGEVAPSDRNPEEAKEEWKGAEILSESANRLTSRLATSGDISEKIKIVLTETFVADGYKLEIMYPVENAREIGKKLIIKSSDSIFELLDDNQKEAFKQLLRN